MTLNRHKNPKNWKFTNMEIHLKKEVKEQRMKL